MKGIDELLLLRAVESFLHHEAMLLDTWQLDEWLSLFLEDCAYEVTPTSEDRAEHLSPDNVLFLISDDRFMLEQRILRLGDDETHSERPRSRIRHFYSNIEIMRRNEDHLAVNLNALVFRSRRETDNFWVSENRFELTQAGAEFRIRRKRIILTNDALMSPGMGILSFIL